MAHTASALKNYRKMLKRRERNVAASSRFKTDLKKVQAAIAKGDADGARKLLPVAMQSLDKAAKIGVIHKNTAANKKSGLAKAIGRMKPAAAKA